MGRFVPSVVGNHPIGWGPRWKREVEGRCIFSLLQPGCPFPWMSASGTCTSAPHDILRSLTLDFGLDQTTLISLVLQPADAYSQPP